MGKHVAAKVAALEKEEAAAAAEQALLAELEEEAAQGTKRGKKKGKAGRESEKGAGVGSGTDAIAVVDDADDAAPRSVLPSLWAVLPESYRADLRSGAVGAAGAPGRLAILIKTMLIVSTKRWESGWG